MNTNLTYTQRAIINYLRTRTAGCMHLAGRWVWPSDVRDSVRLADAIYRELFTM